MSVPPENEFLKVLDKEIENAQEEARKIRSSPQEEGYHDGYLEGLKWVSEYFRGP